MEAAPFSQDFKIFYYSAKTFFDAPLNIYNEPISGIPDSLTYITSKYFFVCSFRFIAGSCRHISALFTWNNCLYYFCQDAYQKLLKSGWTLVLIRFREWYMVNIFGFGPFIQNIRQGQVTSFVLLSCVIFYYLMIRGKFISSTLFFYQDFGIKLYPIILFPTLLKKKNTNKLQLEPELVYFYLFY